MRITDTFLGEHGVFYAQFDHFERALEWAERRGVRLPERRGRPVRPPAA
jgi:hypothetical protein